MKIIIFLTAAVLFAGPALAKGPAAGKPRKAPAPAAKVAPAPKVTAAPAVSTAPAVSASPAVSTAPVVAAAPEAPAAVKPASARPQSCPNCFLPLLSGYKSIVDELKTWTDEMAAQATALDQALSDIQGQIDEKDQYPNQDAFHRDISARLVAGLFARVRGVC